jgi:hypothetical protein
LISNFTIFDWPVGYPDNRLELFVTAVMLIKSLLPTGNLLESTSAGALESSETLTKQEVEDLLNLFTNPDSSSIDAPKYKEQLAAPLDAHSQASSLPTSPSYVVAPPTPVGYTFGYNYPFYLAPNIQYDPPQDHTFPSLKINDSKGPVPRRRNLAASFKNPQPVPLKNSLPMRLRNDKAGLLAFIHQRLRIKMIRKGRVPPKCTLHELVESGCVDGKLRITSLKQPISIQPKWCASNGLPIRPSRPLLPKPE